MRRRVFDLGVRTASRFERPGSTFWNSTLKPALAAVAARNSPMRCSPARGCLRGKKAGLTLGSAISSRNNLSALLMLSGVDAKGKD